MRALEIGFCEQLRKFLEEYPIRSAICLFNQQSLKRLRKSNTASASMEGFNAEMIDFRFISQNSGLQMKGVFKEGDRFPEFQHEIANFLMPSLKPW